MYFSDSDRSGPYPQTVNGDPTPRTMRRGAFTLLEIMAVIVIIGLLAGVVAVSVRSYMITSKQNIARMEVAKICQALDTYYVAHDRYPSNDEGLQSLVDPSPKFPEGLLQKVPRDPWGRPYQYNHPGRNRPFEVISFGADGREGGSGGDWDITSDELGEKHD